MPNSFRSLPVRREIPHDRSGHPHCCHLGARPVLLLADRIASAVQAAGARSIIVKEGASLLRALDDRPELVVVDLAADWQEPVRRAKRLPHMNVSADHCLRQSRGSGRVPRGTRDRLRICPTPAAHFIDELPAPAAAPPSPTDALDRGLGCGAAATPLPRRRTI